ncbi:hypothetical protein [Saccharopolyspora sp. 5N708]|uniref:hypothetical protein n=1 Tax=Saccharopolyspora sp. 5N708 TaxID=3457424 RepID=UPI003FD5C018
MRTPKRVMVAAALSFPMMLGATSIAMADENGDSPTQTQNQDQIQAAEQENKNESPAVFFLFGKHPTAVVAPVLVNQLHQDQVGDWDENEQDQSVKDKDKHKDKDKDKHEEKHHSGMDQNRPN